jgi:thiol oxidase
VTIFPHLFSQIVVVPQTLNLFFFASPHLQIQVKDLKGAVFQADLEQAVKYALFHEIARFSEIDGERMLTLQRFLSVLDRYFPFSHNGRAFFSGVKSYVTENTDTIDGGDFLKKLQQLEYKHNPIFASSRWIGCQSDKIGLRRYPCGVWTLFHFLTVQAAENENADDPLEVLQAMHGYIKYYFGCSGCSQHFQDMAERNKIWSVSNKDDAVLWLWAAHNEVNKRLAGDVTEDVEYPKIQFPTRDVCIDCRKMKVVHVKTLNYDEFDSNETIEWNKTEVLNHLKRVYIASNISQLGVDSEMPAVAARLQQNRTFSNVFTDLDMRVGVLLYVFCIGMMIFAAKLFIRRGYRKKMYTHDLLGKV